MFCQSALRFFGLIIGSLLLASIPSQRVLAQSSAAASFRVMSYQTVKAPGTDLMLVQGVLGTDGTTLHPATAIPRGFALTAVAQSGTRNLYLLRKTGKDSVMLLLTDSLGRTLQQRRQYMPKMGGASKILSLPHLLGLPNGGGFVLAYPAGKSARPVIEVQALNAALAIRWQQQLAPNCLSAVQHITTSDTHLWLVLTEYLALAERPRVLSFRLATGEVACNQPLAPNDELEIATVVPAGLLIVGISDRRTSYVPPIEQNKLPDSRRDFALLLSPTGERQFGVGLGWPLPDRPPHHQWQAAGVLPDGSYQLIGETYRKVPNAGNIAFTLLGAGMVGALGSGVIPLGGYINVQPVGLVLAQLGSTGQLTAVHELAVPEVLNATSSTTKGDNFPQDPPTSFRFRGVSPDYQHIILNTNHQVQAYSMATQQLRPLTVARSATPTVRYIEAGRVTISWSAEAVNTGSEFEQITLP